MKPSEIELRVSAEKIRERERAQAEEAQRLDRRLDEELKQSFPASDPLPWHHDIEPSSVVKVSDDSKLEKRDLKSGDKISHRPTLKSAHNPIHQSGHKFELTAAVNAVDHRLGSEHAPVTIVEYGDFECPNCKQAASAVKLLLTQFAGKICFVFRHFPVEEIHPHALHAAEAAECAAGQGKFWQMHDLLFENQAHLKPHQLRNYAEQLQLDMTRFTAEMDDEIYLQRVREHQQSGNASGVRGTPTFYIDGKIHDVSFGLHALAEGVTAALRR